MATKFLFIDDEPTKAEGMIKPLANDELILNVEGPKSWNEQKSELIDRQSLNNYDGLLLDLKLEFSSGESNNVKFNGVDLAQSIRTDVKSGKVIDLPIFLCSTNANFLDLFDKTSRDLFDKVYKKEVNFENDSIRPEFIAFAQAYKIINKSNDSPQLFKKDIGENDDLFALNIELSKCQTTHEKVYIMNHHVMQSNGILLNEQLMAIRLGVDIAQSNDWENFKMEILAQFQYEGILSGCYKRWWQMDMLNWWKKTMGRSLQVMTAQERVEAISKNFGKMGFTAIVLPKFHRFDSFWYKCFMSNTPLESSDALRTTKMPRYVWEEPSYISISYIKSDERDRQGIMSLLGANEQKIVENLSAHN